MKLDVVFTPTGLTAADIQGRTVFVIDILRATTVMCAALAHGAKALIPVASTEEALRLAQTIGSDDVLLAGERNCLRIPGFQLGNSPLEMREPAVRGKTLIVTTTNGTKALLACQGAAAVYPRGGGEPVPRRGAHQRGHRARRRRADRVRGRSGAFALDDAYCAGRLIAAALDSRKPHRALNDAGLATLDLVRRYGDRWERPLSRSRGGRELIKVGLRDDILDASRLDAYPVLPHFHERRVTLTPVPV